MKFLEPTRKPKVIYTDNSWEFGKSCEELSWNRCTSTPHRSETSGIAERAVGRVKEVTSAVLLQSGLNDSWWADSMECYTHPRNIQDLLSDGKTPCERRIGMPLHGPVIPFGAMVEYHPISSKDISRLHQFCPKVLPSIFLSYVLYAGRNWERIHCDRRHWRIGGDGRIRTSRHKAQCKVSVNADERWKFRIPSRRWNSQNSWRRSTSETIHLNQGSSLNEERNKKVFEENQTDSLLQTLFMMTQHGMMRKLKNDFWSITGDFIYRHHVEPRVKLYMPKEESFPVPLKYIDVARTTHTSLDVLLEKHIDDYWNVDGERELSDAWTGLHKIHFF